MNLPNKLTLFRVLLIPVFVVILIFYKELGIELYTAKYIAAAIFIFASCTDAVDGYIARKYNMITNFGKFMDPLADKLLVTSAMISMIGLPANVIMPSWVVVIVIAREFIITGFRLVAAEKKIVIAAGFWGKIKTVTQMVMITVVLLDFGGSFFYFAGTALIVLSVIFTVISAVDYIIKNLDVFKD